ncbi:MAG: AraC family transcriptional regulator [Flaviaesturariibacter sp.]|nr:AraC family transcriptional regulator [Flaviaesturariibacter sp.]
MQQAPSLIATITTSDYDLISETVQQIPDAVQYSIKRFVRPQTWAHEDMGLLHYEYGASGETQSLQLHFCLAGNTYCSKAGKDCDSCQFHPSGACPERLESLDALSFTFTPSFLSGFAKTKPGTTNLSERLLSFRHITSFSKAVPLCNKTRAVLEGLLNHNYTGSLENIYVNAQMQMLLLYSLNCMIGDREPETFECKFLANVDDREKIMRAREVLLQHIGEPLTIKELSRKVAINECYLKKGFKELFGTTIFDFYQSQRMEHAKYLLYEKGLSVTEVSAMLGYSSISHFSTAFKKHTGIKPCELLLR